MRSCVAEMPQVFACTFMLHRIRVPSLDPCEEEICNAWHQLCSVELPARNAPVNPSAVEACTGYAVASTTAAMSPANVMNSLLESIDSSNPWQVGLVLLVLGLGLFKCAQATSRLLCFLFRHFVRPASKMTKYGKWAIVTGATDGIGREYCDYLAQQGELPAAAQPLLTACTCL